MEFKYIYGPVPSRRLGSSLGISPIPEKTCNYNCIYCQLGRTNRQSNKRQEFFPLAEIIRQFKDYQVEESAYDVVSLVGEGEPILYARLGELISEVKKYTSKPVAVITNGSLLYDPQVRRELCNADIVLPTLDAFDEESYCKINRPCRQLNYEQVVKGLISFSHEFTGQLWLEVMLVDGINTDEAALLKLAEQIKAVRHDKVYVNTPVRPPAEADVRAASQQVILKACELFNGISIDMLASGAFYSDISDLREAILSIASRHPMSRFELAGFLQSRGVEDTQSVFAELERDPQITVLNYKGIYTYRAKKQLK